MIGNPLLLGDEGYQISRSVRLRSSASAYFNRTPASAGNRKTWTWSGWVKRGTLGTTQTLLGAGLISGTFNYTRLFFDTSNRLVFAHYPDTLSGWLTTAQVFRDPSAWYHIDAIFDSTAATASDRLRLFVNGVQITAFTSGSFATTYPALNTDSFLNTTSFAANIGCNVNGGTAETLDGYLAEVNFIDGQALTPSAFGQIDPVTGVWAAKKYAGTYGTNGFYLPFTDNSAATAAAIGADRSGNGNNWTPNNISVTAGVTYDSMLDVPLGAGGAERGNYCTLNPLAANSAVTAAQGNLSYTSSNDRIIKSTISVTSGKWYWEFAPGGGGSTSGCGAINPSVNIYAVVNLTLATAGVSYLGNGNKSVNGTATSYGATYTSGNTIGVALDLDTNAITFYKDNTSQGSISITSGLEWCPAFDQNTGTNYVNFGQRPFAYTPPTGFKALNTQNLPEPAIKKGNQYFDATLYTGNGSTQSIVNAGGFQPDLVWSKSRSAVESHRLEDSVRGATQALYSNLTNAEATEAQSITAFGASGFTLGTGTPNTSAVTYVGWQWKAGGSTVTNTDGSITSMVSAGVTQGFSVVTFTGNGSNPVTVGHGLGAAPRIIFFKRRNASVNWFVYAGAAGNGGFEGLNTTAAYNNGLTIFNSTAPTSTVFSLGNTDGNASGGTYVAYCFAAVAGYSAFGRYTGNGSADGPFVFLGFRPRFVMWKRTDSTSDWGIVDAARPDRNVVTGVLYANLSNAEVTSSGECDFTANGFKIRDNSNRLNASGGNYIFAAFAENPFKLSLAR